MFARVSLAAAAFAACTFVTPAVYAQTKGLITHFTPQHVAQGLKELGVTTVNVRQEKGDDGKPFDVVTFEIDGLKHVAFFVVCNSPKGCLGLKLLTVWLDAGRSANRTTLNKFNSEYGFGKGYVGPNNTLIMERYAISDGGVTMENLKANIGNFVGVSRTFQAYMQKGGGSEASLPADATYQHASAPSAPADSAAIVMTLGTSQGVNSITLPVEAAEPPPAVLKPAK